MSFDYTTLVTDRTAADVARVKALAAKGWAAMTADEQAEWLTDMKGAYNAGDLNRVSACLEDLVQRFGWAGYAVPGYERLKIERSGSRLPEGYTEVEYIQSSGTQCVDTGFMPNQDTRVVMDAQMTMASTSTFYFGARTSPSSVTYNVLYGSSGIRSDYGTSRIYFTDVNVTDRLLIDKNKNVCTINGSEITNDEQMFQSELNLYLCAVNNNGRVAYFSSLIFYSCQIYDNGTLVRDFVPCINADNAVGLYDLVNDQFYGNAGTGTFTAGDAVAAAPDTDGLDPYTWYETDAPTESEAAQYLSNVAAVRRVVAQAATTPTTPESMAGLTVDTANDIETILADTDRLVTNISKAWYYSGEAYAGEI